MKKSFSVSMLMAGTMIGAGYASGQEIASFFGYKPGIFVPVFCGVLFFVFSTVLLLIGKKMNTESLPQIHTKLFGKLAGAIDIVMLFNGTIILAAMLGAMDIAFQRLFGFAFPYGVCCGMLCAFILRSGKGLIGANAATVPLIVLFLSLTCITSPMTVSVAFSVSSLMSCFTYVSMNLLLSAGILVRINGLSTKQILIASLISSTVIASLMALICAVLPFAEGETMPLLTAAGSGAIYYLFMFSLIIAIFTTLLSALSTLRSWGGTVFGDNDLAAFVALIIAGLTACIGFEKVIGFFYPLIGIAGVAYIAGCAVYLIRKSPVLNKYLFGKHNNSIHHCGKQTKYNSAGHD